MLDSTEESGRRVPPKDMNELIISFCRAAGNGDIEFITRTLYAFSFDINQQVVSFTV
jgi:hypothetical protein